MAVINYERPVSFKFSFSTTTHSRIHNMPDICFRIVLVRWSPFTDNIVNIVDALFCAVYICSCFAA